MATNTYFIGAGDDAWKLALLLPSTLDHSFDDTRMVGAQIHEDVGHAGVP